MKTLYDKLILIFKHLFFFIFLRLLINIKNITNPSARLVLLDWSAHFWLLISLVTRLLSTLSILNILNILLTWYLEYCGYWVIYSVYILYIYLSNLIATNFLYSLWLLITCRHIFVCGYEPKFHSLFILYLFQIDLSLVRIFFNVMQLSGYWYSWSKTLCYTVHSYA